MILVIVFGIIKYSDNKVVVEIPTWNTICFEKTCFDIEIADTSPERQQWLMHRTSMDKSNGMLFVFDQPGVHSFWMKNTLIPLDIIWMNEEYQVVYIQHSAQPCIVDTCQSYNPSVMAYYALELNGWVAGKIGLEIWETIERK